MGELVRRLDYERRSRNKSLMTDSQRINREYSQPVRSANAMEDRKKDLYIKRTELHTKMFLNRYEFEKKVVEHFKEDLDTKSPYFNEEKFQQLRAQSAMPRIQGNSERTRPITEIIPRHYYRSEDRTPEVKFKDISPPESVKSGDTDNQYRGSFTANTNDKTNHGSEASAIALGLKVTLMNRRSSVQVLRRRRISIAYTTEKPEEFDLKCLPARAFRRKSAPPMISNVFVPPEPSSFGTDSRRGSRSSIGSVSEMSEVANNHRDIPTRSYRVLREAFKKQKKVKDDPTKDRFNAIKAEHQKQDELLREQTLDRFYEIFEGHEYNVY